MLSHSSHVFFAESLLSRDLVESCSAVINKAYASVEAASSASASPTPGLPTGEKFMPTASSFTIGAVMTEADVRGIERAISRSQAAAWLKRQLSERVLCNRDHSWVRRQYAPCRYPRFHAPHGWHQDGALGFDFLSHPDGNYPANALLKVATCWIALDRCGVVAPGLELITETLPQLLPPSELAESRLRSRFPVQSFWRPAMQPGDALLFLGDVLHRTHVTPEMNGDRTSIELRFFAAENIPHRLKADRFVPL